MFRKPYRASNFEHTYMVHNKASNSSILRNGQLYAIDKELRYRKSTQSLNLPLFLGTMIIGKAHGDIHFTIYPKRSHIGISTFTNFFSICESLYGV